MFIPFITPFSRFITFFTRYHLAKNKISLILLLLSMHACTYGTKHVYAVSYMKCQKESFTPFSHFITFFTRYHLAKNKITRDFIRYKTCLRRFLYENVKQAIFTPLLSFRYFLYKISFP